MSLSDRRFSVHGVDEAPSRALVVDGASFEAAALTFIEDRHITSDATDISLMVEDCETGERQCFRVDLDTGETAPCG